MADFELDILINAPLETVWQSWDRFGDIAKFSKGLRASALLAGSPATGQGAKRRCDMKNGKSYLLEEIRAYTPMERMDIAVFESNLPVKTALLQLRFSARTASTTRITAPCGKRTMTCARSIGNVQPLPVTFQYSSS